MVVLSHLFPKNWHIRLSRGGGGGSIICFVHENLGGIEFHFVVCDSMIVGGGEMAAFSTTPPKYSTVRLSLYALESNGEEVRRYVGMIL